MQADLPEPARAQDTSSSGNVVGDQGRAEGHETHRMSSKICLNVSEGRWPWDKSSFMHSFPHSRFAEHTLCETVPEQG